MTTRDPPSTELKILRDKFYDMIREAVLDELAIRPDGLASVELSVLVHACVMGISTLAIAANLAPADWPVFVDGVTKQLVQSLEWATEGVAPQSDVRETMQ